MTTTTAGYWTADSNGTRYFVADQKPRLCAHSSTTEVAGFEESFGRFWCANAARKSDNYCARHRADGAFYVNVKRGVQCACGCGRSLYPQALSLGPNLYAFRSCIKAGE